MAFWEPITGKIIEYPPEKQSNGWTWVDCGCCGGLNWGGEYPTECRTCGGSGFYYIHEKSRVIAQYPGGPLLGRLAKTDGRG